jgi:hypothetical protein
MCERCKKRYLKEARARAKLRKKNAAYAARIRAYNTAYQRERRARIKRESDG